MTTPEPDPSARAHERTGLVALALALAAGALLFRLLVSGRLEQTSALFIGVPTLLSIWIALLPPAKTAMGAVMRATTLALLMSGIVLGEGLLCIVFAAPLFYLVAYLGASSVIALRSRKDAPTKGPRVPPLKALVLLPLLLSSLEGVTPGLSLERREWATAQRIVDGAPEDVARALESPLRSDIPLPARLAIGFPRPASSTGSELVAGEEREIHFTGGEGRPPGTLKVVVTEASPNHVVFAFPEDTSHITHWLRWREARVDWEPAGAGRTRIVWRLAYDRGLDPAWYWRPFMRFFVAPAAEYLIDAAATPHPNA